MIQILGNIPNEISLACSGGVDSMAVLDFLRKGNKKVEVLYFNHKTEHSENIQKELWEYCSNNNIPIKIGYPHREKSKDESLEEYWRSIRYHYLINENSGKYVITAHHLDDVVETYIFSSLHGKVKLIKPNYKNIHRPFLMTRKSDLERWCLEKKIPFWEDKSNHDIRFARNRIRKQIMPEVLVINPGIHKTVKKLVKESFNNQILEKS